MTKKWRRNGHKPTYKREVEEIVLVKREEKLILNKAIAMMRRKSPRSEIIYLIEIHCQANISK